MFRINQKVVCVNADGCERYGLIEGGIYTIARFHQMDLFSDRYQTWNGVKLQETGRQSFAAPRFRPIVDTKTEVSWTIGAPDDSEQWDNRKVKVKK